MRNHLDSWRALWELSEKTKDSGAKAPSVLILEVGKDDLSSASYGDRFEKRHPDLGFHVKRKVVGRTLHTEIIVRPKGRLAIVEVIQRVAQE